MDVQEYSKKLLQECLDDDEFAMRPAFIAVTDTDGDYQIVIIYDTLGQNQPWPTTLEAATYIWARLRDVNVEIKIIDCTHDDFVHLLHHTYKPSRETKRVKYSCPLVRRSS